MLFLIVEHHSGPETNWQIFLQQRWVYSGSAENCNLGSATKTSHVQVPTRQGKEVAFKRKDKKVGRAIVNKEPMAFIGWVLPWSQGVRDPPSGLPTLFNWNFHSLVFYCRAKETINKMKRQPMDGKKIYANDATDKRVISGTSLVVQWLRLCASNAGGADSIPGRGTKIPHAMQCGKKKKE